MDAEKRLKQIRMLEKMARNPAFSEKIGVRDISIIRVDQTKKKQKRRQRKWNRKGERDVFINFFDMFDMGGWKTICIWSQSSLGNFKTAFDGGIFTAAAFRNGHMWTD